MSQKTVCVSGVTGFIAAQLVKDLLARGYIVHGTARNISNAARLQHVTSLPNASQNLKLFEADLLKSGAYDEALQGCSMAVHVASPYVMNARDPQKELVDPAVKGTQSFLASCANVRTIRKVVVTSSITAVTDSGVPGKVFDESDWNTTSSLKRLPYYYSKVMAEKEVWKFAETKPEIKVVTINPTMVIGPSLVKTVNASVSPFLGYAGGAGAPPGVIDLVWNVVDVRDVSLAHVAALESENASGRYICSSDGAMHVRDVIGVIKSKRFAARDRDFTAPWVSKIIRFVSSFSSDQTMVYAKVSIGNPIVLSNEKIKKELAMTFREPETTICDMLDDFVKWGHLPAPTEATSSS